MLAYAVSVIIVTHNRDELLLETLKSVRNQSLESFQCIVVDDGQSNIANNEIFQDPRFVFLRRYKTVRKGLSSCRNLALDISEGAYIHFLDDDDLLHPDCLKIKYEAARTLKASYVISPLLNFHYQFDGFRHGVCEIEPLTVNWKEYILGQTGIYSCSPLWHRTNFEGMRFDEDLKVSEDWDLYRKLFKIYQNGVYVSCPLYFRRIHSNTNSARLRSGSEKEINSYVLSRERAFWELYRDDDLDRSLAIYFMKFSIKYKRKNISHALKEFDNREKIYSLKDKLTFLKMKFYK